MLLRSIRGFNAIWFRFSLFRKFTINTQHTHTRNTSKTLENRPSEAKLALSLVLHDFNNEHFQPLVKCSIFQWKFRHNETNLKFTDFIGLKISSETDFTAAFKVYLNVFFPYYYSIRYCSIHLSFIICTSRMRLMATHTKYTLNVRFVKREHQT